MSVGCTHPFYYIHLVSKCILYSYSLLHTDLKALRKGAQLFWWQHCDHCHALMLSCNKTILDCLVKLWAIIVFTLNWLLVSWLLHEQKLIPTFKSWNLADVSTECISLHQGERWGQKHSVKCRQGFPICLYQRTLFFSNAVSTLATITCLCMYNMFASWSEL